MLQPISSIIEHGSPPVELMVWNIADVGAVIEAAGRQLRQEPNKDRRWIASLKAYWPETTQDQEELNKAQWDIEMARWKAKITEAELNEATWVNDPLERHRISEEREAEVRVPATNADATALDALTDWLWWPRPGMRSTIDGFHVVIPPDIRGIVIARAIGLSFRSIAKIRLGHGQRGSHTTVWRMYRAAVRIMVDRLNRE